jgi:hypothetical protein
MRYSDDSSHLRVEIRAQGCDIPADERTRMQAAIADVGEVVRDFPASDLEIRVLYHPHSRAYHVEFKLKLPGRTLFTSDSDAYLDAAFQRGLRELVREAEACRDHPDRRAAEAAGQRLALDRDVVAPEDPDAGRLAEAVRNGDYRTFRTALTPYEEWLRKRVGRWVQRYPEAQSRVVRGLLLGDVIEEVYLSAFEGFSRRPTDVRFSEWLDGLIDPSLKALLRHPDEERERASLARTLREAPLGTQ